MDTIGPRTARGTAFEPLPTAVADGAWVIVAGVTPIDTLQGSAATAAVR